MNGELQGEAVLKTLLLSDLVRSTNLVEQMGDRRTARLFALHDARARELFGKYGGLEIDKADGFLLLFDHPLEAVRYALEYHAALEEMEGELAARVGIHFGEVFLRSNPPEHVERGAKPIEVEGLAKPITARLTSLAGPRQTLLTRGAYELGRRAAVDRTILEDVVWLNHGPYRLQGLRMPLRIFEVGVEGFAPLRPPGKASKVQPAFGEMTSISVVDPEEDDSSTATGPTGLSQITRELPALVQQIVQAVEASRAPARRRGWRWEWLVAAAFLLALLAVEESRMGILRERAAQATERAERAERSEEQLSALLQVFFTGGPGLEAPGKGSLLDVEDFERTADRAGFLAAIESGARFARDGRELSEEEVREILDSFGE